MRVVGVGGIFSLWVPGKASGLGSGRGAWHPVAGSGSGWTNQCRLTGIVSLCEGGTRNPMPRAPLAQLEEQPC